jgi:hypothetical protein
MVLCTSVITADHHSLNESVVRMFFPKINIFLGFLPKVIYIMNDK